MTNKNKAVDEIEEEAEVEITEAVNDLSFFMPGVAEDVEEVERLVSKRFKDKKGDLIKFRFKPITTTRIDELEKMNMVPEYSGTRRKKVGEKLDNARFMANIAVESTIYPNFRSAELRKAYSEQDPVEVAKKMLHIGGEFSVWLGVASEINGFDDSIEDMEEAAKN